MTNYQGQEVDQFVFKASLVIALTVGFLLGYAEADIQAWIDGKPPVMVNK